MKFKITHGADIETCTPAEMEQILKGRDAGYNNIYDVVVGDFKSSEAVLLTTPPAKRLRVTRNSGGSDAFVVPVANVVKLLDSNEGRLAGQVVNYGASAAFVYLSALADLQGSEQHARPAIWLSGNGGSWDFQVSSIVWGGTVCAQAIGADTTLTVIEL